MVGLRRRLRRVRVDLGNVDEKIREALHDVFAEIFTQFSRATDGLIVIHDLKIDTYSVSVSVTMKPREEEPEEPVDPKDKFRRGIEKGGYRSGSTD